MAEFLLEIGLEEIPARMIAAAQASWRVAWRRCSSASAADRRPETVDSYSTPRRLGGT